jgi:hypothetical protein
VRCNSARLILLAIVAGFALLSLPCSTRPLPGSTQAIVLATTFGFIRSLHLSRRLLFRQWLDRTGPAADRATCWSMASRRFMLEGQVVKKAHRSPDFEDAAGAGHCGSRTAIH